VLLVGLLGFIFIAIVAYVIAGPTALRQRRRLLHCARGAPVHVTPPRGAGLVSRSDRLNRYFVVRGSGNEPAP
jgi:hypothetical protein